MLPISHCDTPTRVPGPPRAGRVGRLGREYPSPHNVGTTCGSSAEQPPGVCHALVTAPCWCRQLPVAAHGGGASRWVRRRVLAVQRLPRTACCRRDVVRAAVGSCGGGSRAHGGDVCCPGDHNAVRAMLPRGQGCGLCRRWLAWESLPSMTRLDAVGRDLRVPATAVQQRPCLFCPLPGLRHSICALLSPTTSVCRVVCVVLGFVARVVLGFGVQLSSVLSRTHVAGVDASLLCVSESPAAHTDILMLCLSFACACPCCHHQCTCCMLGLVLVHGLVVLLSPGGTNMRTACGRDGASYSYVGENPRS